MHEQASQQPRRCNKPTHYAGMTVECSLVRGHPGPHRTWVEQADDEAEFGEGEREWDRYLQERR